MSHGRHVLDEYRLEKVIRSTAWTTVIRAIDPATSHRVAIKLVYPPAAVVPEANRSAFLHAAEVARVGGLRGIPKVLDYGFTPDDQAFLVMGMAEIAVPISGLAGSPPRRWVEISARIVDAVDALGLAGAAHLNLRIDNVLITADDRPLLTGIGTAPYLAGAAVGRWPATDDPWAAPELARPEVLLRGDVSRADLYSLAGVLCALLGAGVRRSAAGEPEVRLPDAVVADRDRLEAALAEALRPDLAERSSTLSDLRLLLVPATASGADDLDPAGFETREITMPVLEEPSTPVPSMGEWTAEPVPPVEPAAALPPEPEPTAPDAGPPPAEPAPPPEPLPAPAEAPERSGPRWEVIAPAAAALLLVAVVILLWIGRGSRDSGEVAEVERPTPVPTAAAAATAVPRPTVVAVHPALQVADRLLMEGDMDGAREVLGELSDEEVAGFNEMEEALFDELTASFGEADRAKALADLRGGLEYGSVPMLRRGVAGLSRLSRAELADEPGVAEQLDHGRRALEAHARLRSAEQEGDPLAVVGSAVALIELLPDYSRAYSLRDEAAAAVELGAEAAAADRDLTGALATYRELERRWPDRPGLTDRIAWCEEQLRSDAKMESVLAEAASAGERGDPEQGLRVLGGTVPTEPYADRFAALRSRLGTQLAAMDAKPPQITLPPDFDPVVRKNEPLVVPIQVRDDYRIERVAAWVRTVSDRGFREVVLADEGGGLYPLRLDSEAHGNERVLLYVVATDRSDHQSLLGSPEQPLSLERRKWFQRLTGGGG